MSIEKKGFIFAAILAAFIFLSVPLYAAGRDDSGTKHSSEFVSMPGPGKKISIGNEAYLLYSFAGKPKMGTVILKVQVFNKAGEKDTSMTIMGDSGMPSMRGAHDTGDRPFQISKNKDYLLPINIVMPGEWEIRVTVTKAGKVIFRGSHRFDV